MARVVVGGTVAALVTAERLAAAGEPVELLLPEKGVGGGMTGMLRDGRVLELGMRVLELEHEAAPAQAPPLDGYAPGPAGHLPWLATVRAYVHDLVGDRLVALAPPRMALDGRLHADPFLTLDPRGLTAGLDAAARDRVAIELAGEDERGALGAPLEDVSLATASRRNHGPLLHDRLVAPVTAKLLDGGAERVLAGLRRRVWQPLFWPGTVRQACTGGSAFVPSRPLLTVSGAGCGELVAALLARLHAAPHAHLRTVGKLASLRPDGDGVELGFASGAVERAERPVLATSAGELFAAAGAPWTPERARTVVAWVDAAEDDLLDLPPVTTIVDPGLPALRVTATGDAPAGRRLLCVELRWDLPEADVSAAVRTSLEGAGLLVKDGRLWPITSVVAPTYPVPTQDTAASFRAAKAALEALLPGADVLGGGAHLAGDYVNEQLVAGLATAERLT